MTFDDNKMKSIEMVRYTKVIIRLIVLPSGKYSRSVQQPSGLDKIADLFYPNYTIYFTFLLRA